MITLSDPIKNTALQNLLKTQTSLNISAGATIEYNLNIMVNKIKATSNGADHTLSGAFKKLFPIDTIYKPFRPLSPGIKYLIYTVGNTDTTTNSFANPRSIDPGTKPRLYYPGSTTYYKYWLGPKNTNIDISLEYFDDDIDNPIVVKNILTNKIVARFETSHDTPTSWTITVTKSDGSTVSKTGTALNSNGEAVIHYNGTDWSLIEPEIYNATQSIKKVSLSATNSNSGKFLAVLELSPKWIKDLSNDVKTFDITKETGADNSSMLPVGTLTANTLNISINKFRQGFIDLVEYDKDLIMDNTKTYLCKNAIIKPYIKVINGSDTYNINQGLYYILNWNMSEFGEADILALDSAKILQETMCPELLVQDSPITSIIRRLLDSIGFSNYKINVKKDEQGKIIDESISTVRYWWTEPNKTVWEAIQELCRDIQMNAFVDENNILNFYSRDYIYDSSKNSVFDFTSETDGTVLPNIMSLNLQELPSVNEVKVLWSAPQSSQYDGASSPLWKSEESFLGAGALAKPLADAEPIDPNDYFILSDNTLSPNQNIRSLFNYSGYVLINNEIIEYDGIEYQYVPLDSNDNNPIPVIIKSASDISKYRALSKAGYSNINDVNSAYFRPTGRYKIKTRGALQTKRISHSATPTSFIGTDPNQFSLSTMSMVTPLDGTEKPGTGSFKTPTAPASRTVSKSFLSLSNLDKDKTTFSVAKKSFDSIDTSAEYFAFGTRMYFDTQFESPEQVGGFGIFTGTGESGTNGYYIVIHTTASAKMKKDLRLIKQQTISNKKRIVVLKDSQNSSLNTLAGIYAGQAYNIDVIIKKITDTDVTKNKNEITVFVNGFKVSAFDNLAEIGDIDYTRLSPTKNIALLCGQGIVYFEYAYAKSINKSEYDSIKNTSNYMYNGVYSDDTLSMMYGDLIYNLGDKTVVKEPGLVEFGTTGREIRNAKVRYSDTPAIPIKFSTSKNRYATILSSRIQPFGGEIFVLNNTSTYIPLDDGNYSSFYVLGNSIYKSGIIEYNTYTDTDNKNIEPAIFQSNWIQSEEDAKSLANWIKSSILNKNKYINLEVFGNPLVCPGDIVTINYPLQGLLKSEAKYIVVRATTSYSEGISTQIVCRAI